VLSVNPALHQGISGSRLSSIYKTVPFCAVIKINTAEPQRSQLSPQKCHFNAV